uniref:Uncharacterized protein n=1 Tax=Mustela putorius furo TaxID=9669 RepID=M3Z166_MUSPF
MLGCRRPQTRNLPTAGTSLPPFLGIPDARRLSTRSKEIGANEAGKGWCRGGGGEEGRTPGTSGWREEGRAALAPRGEGASWGELP